MHCYVIYTRVSTKDQGRSGLGLEAQERDIAIFLEHFSGKPYEVLGRFSDVQSGGDDDRPQLAAALAMVRKTGAELLVAKLDRLSRKVKFISALMDEARVKLRVAQMPQADKFSLHIYAALAEQERDFISRRTKDALAAATARGKKLGGLRPKTDARNVAVQVKANREAAKVLKIVKPMREAGVSLAAIAEALSTMKVPTSRGGAWTPMQVSRALKRIAP